MIEVMKDKGFYYYQLNLEDHLFERLTQGVIFEDVTRGRQGNHLVERLGDKVSLVRTTTKYTRPAHCFSQAHHEVIEAIQQVARQDIQVSDESLMFNHALIEIYDRAYYKMGYHSDQMLDLARDSYIALFSCYEHPERDEAIRSLKIKDKTTGEQHTIALKHNSVVMFSLETNVKYLHKIVLEPLSGPGTNDNRWLGLTLRQSNTWIEFDTNHTPRFTDGSELTLATEEQQKQFYKLRGQENRSMDFCYPSLSFTISDADIIKPVDMTPECAAL